MLTKPIIVGVINVTPDSFSDGGNFLATTHAVDHALHLLADGADVLDIGGESTRPGAVSVTVEEEIQRVVPVIREVHARQPTARLSIDTTKAEVARAALEAGATIVNDVSAHRLDPSMAELCAETGCTVVLMHSRGGTEDMASYQHAEYADGDRAVVEAVIEELESQVERALQLGVKREAIVLDPGIGFSKRSEHSLSALANLPELLKLGFPVMVGASRKRFIGELTETPSAQDRDDGTVGAHVAAFALGAQWFRVHNVRAHRHALDVAHAIFDRTEGVLPKPVRGSPNY